MSKLSDRLRQVARTVLPRIHPSAICIGGQKCGTTALYRYLRQHPEIAVSTTKEIDFFCCDARYNLGDRFYHGHYPRLTFGNARKVGVDITPGYLGGAKRAARRIHAYNRNIKLIVLIRDPVDRAFSAWQMYVKLCARDRDWFKAWMCRCAGQSKASRFRERKAFGENFLADAQEEIEALRHGIVLEMPIVQLSLYASYIKHYTAIFSESQMLTLSSERMLQNTSAQMERVCQFIGVSSFPTETVFPPYFKGEYTEGCPQEARELLDSFFAADQVELAGLLSAL
jgi:hypothetical protein